MAGVDKIIFNYVKYKYKSSLTNKMRQYHGQKYSKYSSNAEI